MTKILGVFVVALILLVFTSFVGAANGSSFTGIFSDYGYDKDGNNLYDSLVIEVEINITEPGNYEIEGELSDQSGIQIEDDVEVEDYFDVGLHTISLTFDGKEIYMSKKNGPYVLKEIVLSDVNNDITLSELHNVYTTGSYNYDDFEEGGLEINIITPVNGSTVKGDFTSLMVETDKNAVCEYGISLLGPNYGGASRPFEMEITGEHLHMQEIDNLEETQAGEHYEIDVTCEDEAGNSASAETQFYTNLSELREVMILEDINAYEYLKSIMIDIPEGDDDEVSAMYYAYYDKSDDNYLYFAGIIEAKNESYFDEFFNVFDDGISITSETLNGNDVYFLDEDDRDYGVFWLHGNLIVYIIAAVNPAEEASDVPLSIINAYLAKYPSDLELDTVSPVIELIDPEDDYVKKTSSSSYEIDFKFNVSDESEIINCSLIINDKVEKTNTGIQKDIENSFSLELDRDNYNWEIKCVDSEGNEGSSEVRDLQIKKKSSSSSSSSSSSFIDDFYYIDTPSPSTNNIIEEPKVIALNPKISEKDKGFFEAVIDWFKWLFGIE